MSYYNTERHHESLVNLTLDDVFYCPGQEILDQQVICTKGFDDVHRFIGELSSKAEFGSSIVNERPRKTLGYETPAERSNACCIDQFSR